MQIRRLMLAIIASIGVHFIAFQAFNPARGGRPAINFSPTITARLLPASGPAGTAGEAPAPVVTESAPMPAAAASESAPTVAVERSPPAGASGEQSAPAVKPDPAPVGPVNSLISGGIPMRYFRNSELDAPATMLAPIDNAYPAEAGNVEGSVIVRLLILETGAIEEAAIVEAHPPGVFEKAALAALGRAQFRPGLLYGIPVRTQVMMEMQYRPDDDKRRDPSDRSGAGYGE
jgi:protein TonB